MLLESGDDVDQRDQVLVFLRIYKSNADCKWSIKRRRTFSGAALIQERRLFQLRVKHLGVYRDITQSCEKKGKYVDLEPSYEPSFKRFPTLKL